MVLKLSFLNICCWTSLGRGRGCRFLWAAVAADPVSSALSLHRALQLQWVQLQRVQLPGLDAPSSGKTSVLQPWREYGYSLQWENHTPSCGKTTVLRFSHRRDATTYNGRRKYLQLNIVYYMCSIQNLQTYEPSQ